MPSTNYVFDERTVFLVALETVYGSDPGGGYVSVPIYDTFNIIQPTIGIQELNRAKDSLAADPPAATQALNTLRGTVFVYGSGGNTPPPWLGYLIPACGFKQSTVNGVAPDAPTATEGAAGNIPPGDYEYVITKIDTNRNETPASTVESITVTGTSKVDLTGIPASGPGTKTRIYRSQEGVTGGPWYLVDEIDGTLTSYTDDKDVGGLDFTRTAPTIVNESLFFTWMNENWESLWGIAYLDGHRRISKGTRGTFTAQWRAGEPMQLQMDMQGLYVAPNNTTAQNNPIGSCQGPGIPPKSENVKAVLRPLRTDSTLFEDLGSGAPALTEANSPIIPVIKSLNITLGRTPTARTDANSENSIIEIGLHQRAATRVSMVIEIPKPYVWSPDEDMNRGCNFSFKFEITPRTNVTKRRVEFSMPNLYFSREPRLVREDDGIRCFDLEFVPTDRFSCTDSILIRQY